jgi:taurine transport system substrate-binding protein
MLKRSGYRIWNRISLGLLLISLIAVAGPSFAQGKKVTIGYQLIYGPFLVAIANGDFERATGYKIEWRQFDSGNNVATAMASEDVQVGPVGSSPFAAVVSRGVQLQLFYIMDNIQGAEAMVVRNGAGIVKPADLKGKKVGVPFVSTTHYHLLTALNMWGIDPASVHMLNMQPNQIAAAWDRGDIDAGFVWGPALARIKETGKLFITSGEIGRKTGKRTFDGMAVDRKWAEANPDFMAKFVKVLAAADAAYNKNPKAWTVDSAAVKANVRLIGGDPKDVAETVAGYGYPSLSEQASSAWLSGGAASGAAKALKANSEFLKSQGSIDAIASDYGQFVTAKYAEAALKLK